MFRNFCLDISKLRNRVKQRCEKNNSENQRTITKKSPRQDSTCMFRLREFVHAFTKDVPPLPFGSIPRPCLPVCPRIVVTAVYMFVWSSRNTCTYAHPQTHVYTFLHWRSTNKHTKSQHTSHACMCISRIHTDKMYRVKDACKHATSPRPSRCVSQVVVGWPYCRTLLNFSRCA